MADSGAAMEAQSDQPEVVTCSRLAADLRSLGVRPGGVLMVHVRMSAIGWVLGAAETVVRALLEALGPHGTLAAYADWEEHVYGPEDVPPARRAAWLAEPPVFDPRTAEAARAYGRLPERIRTWPGAVASPHVDARVVAVGARARWLVDEHPPDSGYGPRSPFARLVEAEGSVLLLGAPLETVTLLHHAEAIARAGPKRRLAYRVRTVCGEMTFGDVDTRDGAFDYASLGLEEDPFAAIVRSALQAGIGRSGAVGAAPSHLLPARELTAHAVRWLEERFEPRPPRAAS